MIYRLTAYGGETREFTKPASVRFSADRDAPAHSLEARFPLEPLGSGQRLPEFHTIQVVKDGAVFFRGLIDEQTILVDGDGAGIEVCSRSMAALLLDNEAIPQTYYVPSTRLIYQRHAQPYGFSEFSGKDKAFSTKLQIEKGASEWEVIESFCRDALGTRPQVTFTGELQMEPQDPEAEALFSNCGGIFYASIREERLRCKRLSQVLVRSERLGGYSTQVWDSRAAGDGILLRRLLNAVDDPKTPVFRGQLLLDKSREQAYQLELACPGERILPLETRARVADPVLGDFEALKVSGISYRLDSAGEQTLVILRKDWEAESDVAG